MASLRLAFLTKPDPDSGNFNTAQRICKQLTAWRPTWEYKIIPVPTSCHHGQRGAQMLPAPADLSRTDVLLCLHLYRCAGIVTGASSQRPDDLPPLIGIAGGTDLNVDSKLADRREAMRLFVRECRHVVVFSESMRRALIELIGDSCSQVPISVIPQGIPYPLLADKGSPVIGVEQLVDFQRYFIILGRIRPVKNCCSILEPFRRWSQERRQLARVKLLFVGDIEDSEYGEEVKAKMALSTDVHLLKGVRHEQALQLMRNSLGLINCSLSEGQSNSILEAMSLGVAVIVSAIPGNLDIVRHMQTGFVFQDEVQLLQWMDVTSAQDSDSRRLVARVTDAARMYVQERHSIVSEQRAYVDLITNCCKKVA